MTEAATPYRSPSTVTARSTTPEEPEDEDAPTRMQMPAKETKAPVVSIAVGGRERDGLKKSVT